MALILHIESATGICAVALSQQGKCIAEKYSSVPRTHAQFLTVYIDQLLAESGYNFKQLDAVCVSKGPGSYTGLRIGVAVAKGLCYALEKPLLSVNTLYSMSACMKMQLNQVSEGPVDQVLFCPLIDARRMEVYASSFNFELKEITETKAQIISAESFLEFKEKQLIFFGDGAEKIKTIISPLLKASFATNFQLTAKGMIAESERKLAAAQFENVAYFEPFYLKEFVGGKAAC